MIRMYLHTNQLSILQSSGTAFFHRQWTRVSWNVVVHQLLPNPIAKQPLFAMLHSSLDRRSTENKRTINVYSQRIWRTRSLKHSRFTWNDRRETRSRIQRARVHAKLLASRVQNEN